jgi:hypothetical protein
MTDEVEVRVAPQAAEPETEDKTSIADQGDAQQNEQDNDDGYEIESDSNNQEDNESNDDKDTAGLSDYERMRLERIKRNQLRLISLGLSDGNNIPQVKKKQSAPKKKKSLDMVPTRELPSRAGRAIFMESFTKQKKEKEEEKNLDACYACQVEGGGEFHDYVVGCFMFFRCDADIFSAAAAVTLNVFTLAQQCQN